MNCCVPIITPFTNVSSLTIPWMAAEIEAYGPQPNVQVYYSQDGQYVLSDDFNQVTFEPGSITIDNGGPMTGLVKLF